MDKTVCELFAGVGGFRCGLNHIKTLEDIKKELVQLGAKAAMMSGSGPTVFGIFDDKNVAKEAYNKIKAQGLARQVYLANVHNVRR